MRAPVSRGLLTLAIHCLGPRDREWGEAMRAEFDAAEADGRHFAFAAGCLIAAWQQMLAHRQGRHVVALYAVALGLLIPVAAFQFAMALGISSGFAGAYGFGTVLVPGASNNPILASSQLGAVPCLLALWLVLGLGHLRLAWALVDRDWARIASVSALLGSVVATLFIVMSVLVLDVKFVALHAAIMAVELMALVLLARQQARSPHDEGQHFSTI